MGIAGVIGLAATAGLVAWAIGVTTTPRRDATAVAAARAEAPVPSLASAPAVRERDAETPGSAPRSRPVPPPTALEAAPVLATRDPAEWQGMRVRLDMQQTGCEGSSTCGLAMACHDGTCGPCSADAECGAGEVCVVQHCVLASLAECSRASDCDSGETCMLTGYSAAPRGNEEMRAVCSGSETPLETRLAWTGRSPQEAEAGRPDPNVVAGLSDEPLSTPDRLLAELAAAR